MDKSLTLAVAQGPINCRGPQKRLDWLANLLDTLSDKEIDLLLLPELFLSGYHVGEKLREWAEPADGPMGARISVLAKKHRLAIHYGFPEFTSQGMYNSAQCFDSQGHVLCCQRKLMLPPGFEVDYFKQGKGCQLFSLKGFKIATLICFDAEFPETFRHVSDMGADLVLVPTALGAEWGHVAQHVMPTRAFENGVYVAYANRASEEDGAAFYGGSCIIAPNCTELARAGRDEEVLISKLVLDNVSKARERLPYLAERTRISF